MEKKEVINTKEKMLNSCKKIRKILTVFQWVVAIMFIFVGISIILNGLLTNNLISADIKEKTSIIWQTVENINNMTEKVDEFKTSEENSNIIEIITFISMIIILDFLVKIFKNTEENATPFTEKNIKYIKYIGILVWIIHCTITVDFFDFTFILAIAISSLYYIFKYGYQLQVESDETL